MPFSRLSSVPIRLPISSKIGSGQNRTVTSTRGPMTNPTGVISASLSSLSRTAGELR